MRNCHECNYVLKCFPLVGSSVSFDQSESLSHFVEMKTLVVGGGLTLLIFALCFL